MTHPIINLYLKDFCVGKFVVINFWINKKIENTLLPKNDVNETQRNGEQRKFG